MAIILSENNKIKSSDFFQGVISERRFVDDRRVKTYRKIVGDKLIDYMSIEGGTTESFYVHHNIFGLDTSMFDICHQSRVAYISAGFMDTESIYTKTYGHPYGILSKSLINEKEIINYADVVAELTNVYVLETFKTEMFSCHFTHRVFVRRIYMPILKCVEREIYGRLKSKHL